MSSEQIAQSINLSIINKKRLDAYAALGTGNISEIVNTVLDKFFEQGGSFDVPSEFGDNDLIIPANTYQKLFEISKPAYDKKREKKEIKTIVSGKKEFVIINGDDDLKNFVMNSLTIKLKINELSKSINNKYNQENELLKRLNNLEEILKEKELI